MAKQDRKILTPPESIYSPPGLLGEIVKWIDSCAVHPAPLLSVAAGLSIMATLCGRRYSLPDGLRPAIYLVGIARSGVGKDNGRKCAVSLLDRAGLKQRMGTADVASAAGLVAQLVKCPTKLFPLDEFGRLLEAYTSKNAASHERQVMTTMLQLWSSAPSTFLGKAYAERDVPAVEMPHCVIYGTTTPEVFYKALRGSDVVDGVLSRFLTIEVAHGQLDGVEPVGSTINPPSDLVEKCKRIAEGKHRPGNLAGLEDSKLQAQPFIVRLSDEARAGAKRLGDNVRIKLDGVRHEELWVRAKEQTLRVALAVAIGCDSETIETEHLHWAWNLVRWCVKISDAAVADLVADTDEGRAVLVIRAFMRSSGMMATKSELTRGTRTLTRKLRDDAIKHLLDCDELSMQNVETKGRTQTVYVLHDLSEKE